MKRFLGSVLLIVCLLTALMQPVFATENATEPTETVPTEQTEPTQLPEEPLPEEHIESTPDTRSGNLTTSEAGIAFINEMMGGSYGGTYQLSSAEASVNSFRASYGITLSQTQFDALVDLVMAYGGNILTSGYKVERVIGNGSYTEVELANAFCSWVKSGTEFSQQRLNRRLRELKLFLYGSYDGACYVGFRYVIYNANGGALDDNTVLCYALGSTYSSLPTASRSGKYFAGWYTASSGGEHLSNNDTVNQNYTVYAHWSDTEVDDPNGVGGGGNGGGSEDLPEPPVLKVSEACVQFIKDNEGFVEYPMWDYGQYSVGYGTRCPDDKLDEYLEHGISREEADYLLRVMLKSMEETVDNVLKKATITHTQSQYDAIVSFTYNLGPQWMKESYNIYKYILHGGHTEMQFVNAMGSWCSAGGTILPGLVRRRMDEANMYLNGDYTMGNRNYLCIEFNGMTGDPEVRCYYYKTGLKLDYLPTATREGYKLTGWYDKPSGGTQYTTATVAPSYSKVTAYAHWEVSNEPVPDPTPDPVPDPVPDPTPDPEPLPDSGFTDVPESAWFYPYVLQAVDSGLFNGVSETEFAPNRNMTRAMVVTVLYRMAGSPTVTADAPFADVPADQWFSDAVGWAFENGIVNGVSETRFGVDGNITREQLTAMLYRYAAYCGYEVGEAADLSAFSDAAAVSSYAVEPMRWAVATSIVGGSDGKLDPAGAATRAQCAKMMMVFAERFTVAP